MSALLEIMNRLSWYGIQNKWGGQKFRLPRVLSLVRVRVETVIRIQVYQLLQLTFDNRSSSLLEIDRMLPRGQRQSHNPEDG